MAEFVVGRNYRIIGNASGIFHGFSIDQVVVLERLDDNQGRDHRYIREDGLTQWVCDEDVVEVVD